jgi:hypothetical protein
MALGCLFGHLSPLLWVWRASGFACDDMRHLFYYVNEAGGMGKSPFKSTGGLVTFEHGEQNVNQKSSKTKIQES